MTHKSSINFKVILFYFKQKDTIKVLPILTLSSALVKICQVSHVIFSNHKPFFPQNLHNSSESWKITPLYFCSSNIYTLATRSQLKHKFFSFQVLGSKFVKFLKKVLKWKVNSSSIFVSFFTVMTHNSSVNLKLIHFLPWTKGSHQTKFRFWHFRVLWWKFAKFLMSFSKRQVSFSSNFASLLNVMKDNSSVPFQVKQYILCSKGTH